VLRRCVRSRNLVNEEALAHWGLLRQKQTKYSKESQLARPVLWRTPTIRWLREALSLGM